MNVVTEGYVRGTFQNDVNSSYFRHSGKQKTSQSIYFTIKNDFRLLPAPSPFVETTLYLFK